MANKSIVNFFKLKRKKVYFNVLMKLANRYNATDGPEKEKKMSKDSINETGRELRNSCFEK